MAKEDNLDTIIKQFVDFLMPELTPYESTLYLLLLRTTFVEDGDLKIRIGKRTLAEKFGKGRTGERTTFHYVRKLINKLEERGCIEVGDSNKDGTLLRLVLPADIPLVAEKLKDVQVLKDEDYFNDLEKRKEIFERDKWICQYCGEKVSQENATIDHFIPQRKGGKHTKDNLRVCCHTCNSIKSGKTLEEAAPVLLKSIQERRARLQKI